MRPGNLTQTVWKRSVCNQLKKESKQAEISFGAAECCSATKVGEQTIVTAEATLSDRSEQIAVYAMIKAINDLFTRGAEVVSVQVSYTFPTTVKESVIIRMMDAVKEFTREQQVTLAGLKAQVQPGVVMNQVHVVALGKVVQEDLLTPEQVKPGQELILCGSLALEGMERIVDTSEKELGQRFIPGFLHQMKELKSELLQREAIRAAWGHVTAMRQIGSGGILAALWELAEATKVGLKVELLQMTVCQETIEVCEFYRLNPYQMTSTGAILMVTEHGEELLQQLRAQGVRAARLGTLEEGTTKVILNGNETRYLDRPAPDELCLWQEERLQQ